MRSTIVLFAFTAAGCTTTACLDSGKMGRYQLTKPASTVAGSPEAMAKLATPAADQPQVELA